MGAEVLIVDDDPMVGSLSNDLLTDAGFTTHLLRDSKLVMAAVREHRPKLILLDILMPGIDGLSLLHAIKQDPELAGTKVAVVSGKSFAAERARAKEYGADLFIAKPYDVKAFASSVVELIGEPARGSEAGSRSALRLSVWGAREPGSTPCVGIETLGKLVALDAGLGLTTLGQDALRRGRPKEAWLILSHYHPDHVAGLGAFPLFREQGLEVRVAGPRDPEKNLSARLRDHMKGSFAVDPRPVTARIALHELLEDSYDLTPGIRLVAFYANHPSTTLGFVLELGGHKVVYCPDSEIYGEGATALQDYDEKIGRLVRGAELLIHDARYLAADYAGHVNEGHSSALNAAAFAAQCDVGRLLLFHADPSYPDERLGELEAEASKALSEQGSAAQAQAARDGLVIEL